MNPPAVLLGIYLLLILGVGLGALARVRSAEDFWIAGGRAPALSVAGSLCATILGGSGTLGVAGLAFRRGLTGSWWLLVGAAGLLGLGFFARRLKQHTYYTLPQLIRSWYGPLMGRVAGCLVLAAWLGIVGAQAAAAGTILKTFFGGPPRLLTLAAGAVFIAYTMSGGQLAVMRTDLLQALLIGCGVLLAAFAGLRSAGGLEGLRSALPPGHFSFPLSSDFAAGDLLLLLLVVGSTYLIGPDMLSRVFSSRSAAAARRAIVPSIAVVAVLALCLTLCGMASRALYPEIEPEQALPALVRAALHPWLSALLLLALLSAFLSSADTTLLTMAAIVRVDLLGRGAPKRRTGLAGARLAVLGCGAASLLVGIFSGGIIPALVLGYSVFTGGLFVPILAGLLGKPMRPGAAVTAAGLGGIIALAGKLLASDWIVAFGFAAAAIVLCADMLLRRRSRNR